MQQELSQRAMIEGENYKTQQTKSTRIKNRPQIMNNYSNVQSLYILVDGVKVWCQPSLCYK